MSWPWAREPLYEMERDDGQKPREDRMGVWPRPRKPRGLDQGPPWSVPAGSRACG